jgi:hypothetical protein
MICKYPLNKEPNASQNIAAYTVVNLLTKLKKRSRCFGANVNYARRARTLLVLVSHDNQVIALLYQQKV